MTQPSSRRDPYVALTDASLIAEAKHARHADGIAAERATAVLTVRDVLLFAFATGVEVTVTTAVAGTVCGRVVLLATRFVMIDEPRPVPRIVLIPTGQLVTIMLPELCHTTPHDALQLDDITTLLTMLEDRYAGDAVELTLRDGTTLCAPVVAFGDDVLLLQRTEQTLVTVVACQIALAAIPPPRHRRRSHTGG